MKVLRDKKTLMPLDFWAIHSQFSKKKIWFSKFKNLHNRFLIQGSGTGPLESDIDISDEAGLFLGEDSGGPHSGYHGNSGSSMEFLAKTSKIRHNITASWDDFKQNWKNFKQDLHRIE